MLAGFRYPSPLACWVNDREGARSRWLASLLLVAVCLRCGQRRVLWRDLFPEFQAHPNKPQDNRLPNNPSSLKSVLLAEF